MPSPKLRQGRYYIEYWPRNIIPPLSFRNKPKSILGRVNEGLGSFKESPPEPLLALEHFRINHKDYSLIVSDIRMPTMNGFEFVREARKIDPKVKILLMTAFEIDDKDLARVLPKLKIDGLIRKPASSKQILNTISNLIMDL